MHRWNWIGLLRCVVLAAALLTTAAAGAEPLDLADPRSRDIEVRFERSPRTDPASLDSRYTHRLPARFETGEDGFVRITIAGSVVAASLFEGEQPVPGSFDDFVWVIDPTPGDVVDARLAGVRGRTIAWGLATTETEARVRVRMSTVEPAGSRAPRRILGRHVFGHCDPRVEHEADDCRRVAAVRFDPARGYVNAVGVIEVDTPIGFAAATFSPLGGGIFLEREPVSDALERAPSASASVEPAALAGIDVAAPPVELAAPRAN